MPKSKSTPSEIKERFDKDVERFSNLETGQTAAIDSALMLELISRGARCANPAATSLLDIGCGAGNYTLKMMQVLPIRTATLIDLSKPMLERAAERIRAAGSVALTLMQDDIRDVEIGVQRFDVAVAGAVLHHLREEGEWRDVFKKVRNSLRPGGSFWIADMVDHHPPTVHAVLWERYGSYLAGLKDEAYRDHVFLYIEQEDTPRSLVFHLDLLRNAGFDTVEVLHKNGPFACLVAFRHGASNLVCEPASKPA